jgi:hypothetical protein
MCLLRDARMIDVVSDTRAIVMVTLERIGCRQRVTAD